MTIETFLADWESKSTSHDSKKNVRVYGKLEVSMYQSARNGNTVRLSSIQSTKAKSGEASKFLKWLNNQADKHEFFVTVCVEPFGFTREASFDKSKLKSWFNRNGYKVRENYHEDWGYEMIREIGRKGKK